jgi:hypothetical protein
LDIGTGSDNLTPSLGATPTFGKQMLDKTTLYAFVTLIFLDNYCTQIYHPVCKFIHSMGTIIDCYGNSAYSNMVNKLMDVIV